MPREPKAYLHDMRQAAALIAEFTDGLDFDAYAADAKVRSAVERHRRIIAFRNMMWIGRACRHAPLEPWFDQRWRPGEFERT